MVYTDTDTDTDTDFVPCAVKLQTDSRPYAPPFTSHAAKSITRIYPEIVSQLIHALQRQRDYLLAELSEADASAPETRSHRAKKLEVLNLQADIAYLSSSH